MTNTNDSVRANIGMLLRDHPAGTTADLLDYTVAYWDGHEIMGMHLSADAPGQLDEDFEFSDEFLAHISEAIDDWIKQPRYTFRPQLLEWLKDAPPFDACV